MSNSIKVLHGRSSFLEQHLYLDEKTFEDFCKLQESALKNGINLQVVSGFRNFDRQVLIWNQKASGKRKVYSRSGKRIDVNSSEKKELLEGILFYSAIPGFSRHHWGSDIDVYDANKLSKEFVELTPDECGPGGVFYDLHLWLDREIKTNQSFGFFRPYENDNGGVSQEKWHLSHYPTASKYEDMLSLENFINELNNTEILLKDEILKDPEYYFKKYVINTDSPPRKV